MQLFAQKISPRRSDCDWRDQPGWLYEPIHNAVTLVEMGVEKGAQAILMPVNCRKLLFDLSDDMATKVDIQFYQDGRDALLKALTE